MRQLATRCPSLPRRWLRRPSLRQEDLPQMRQRGTSCRQLPPRGMNNTNFHNVVKDERGEQESQEGQEGAQARQERQEGQEGEKKRRRRRRSARRRRSTRRRRRRRRRGSAREVGRAMSTAAMLKTRTSARSPRGATELGAASWEAQGRATAWCLVQLS